RLRVRPSSHAPRLRQRRRVHLRRREPARRRPRARSRAARIVDRRSPISVLPTDSGKSPPSTPEAIPRPSISMKPAPQPARDGCGSSVPMERSKASIEASRVSRFRAGYFFSDSIVAFSSSVYLLYSSIVLLAASAVILIQTFVLSTYFLMHSP